VAEVLPLLYLHGMSTSDFAPALEQFLGTGWGLSAATIGRLTRQWQDEARAFNDRSLAETDYVYLWVDGIHLKVRLQQDKVCLLVMIGVRADSRKELIALADAHRESTESWADLLRSCKRRGMRAPVLAVDDSALGFWAAIRDVFPETREQRCWFHVGANVLNALPKSAQPGARAALAEIYNAENRERAAKAVKAFEADYGTKWPKAVAKITDNLDVLLEFYDYPAEHWVHLRTTNPIESTFATVAPSTRHQRTRLTRSRDRDGVRTHRISTDPLARRQRTPPRRTGPLRREVRERQTRGTTRRPRRRSTSRVTRAAMRPVGMSVTGNFRVRFGCLTGWGCMDGLKHAGWAGR
jgi:transposase-like protein